MNLRELIKQKGFTNYKVAKNAGIGQTTIYELASGKRKEPRASTVVKIANALDIDVSKVYEAIKEG